MMHVLRCDGFDPLCFLRKMDARERSVSLMRAQGWTVIAWNPTRTITGASGATLMRIERAIGRRKNISQDLPFLGGAIGWIGYDAACELRGIVSRHARMRGIPQVCAHIYETALLWDGRTLIAVGPARFCREVAAIHERPMPRKTILPTTWRCTMDDAAYRRACGRVHRAIGRGDVYQLNLTAMYTATSDNDPRAWAALLLSLHAAPAGCYIEHGKTAVISASPETFVSIRNGVIRTVPIKGTRQRGTSARADAHARAMLLRDPKENAELSMIVDLLRNDLGHISIPGSVDVLHHRATDATPSVWHTSSTIEGTLQRSVTPLRALMSMLPGGSITGCPKAAAIRAIDAYETNARGLYCGSAFMASRSGALESSLLIRTIVRHGKHCSLGTGGGIVWDSRAARERKEMEVKTRAIVDLPSRCTWVDGVRTIGKSIDASIDPAHPRARGVFETMVADGMRIRFLASHLRRLRRSASIVGYPRPPASTVLLRQLRTALSARHTLRVKLVWDGRRTIIETQPLIIDTRERWGIAVCTMPCERHAPEAKALPYHREWSCHRHAQSRGYHEALLRRSDGTITEGATSSLFWVHDGVLATPKRGALPGIMQHAVLRSAAKAGIPIRRADATYATLFEASEVFLTRATTGITPVTSIDGHRIGDGVVGPITQRVQAMLTRPPTDDTAVPRRRVQC